MSSRKTIIVQLRVNGLENAYDRLLILEDKLIQSFSQNRNAVVDGHDIGEETMNIFIYPRSAWSSALEVIFAHLKRLDASGDFIVIKRLPSERYVVVWPDEFNGPFEKL